MKLVPDRERLRSILKWSWFELRAARLRMLRRAGNWRERSSLNSCAVPTPAHASTWSHIIGKSITPLWTAQFSAEEKLVAGKVENLRIATAHLNGKFLGAQEIFSFWSTVGPPHRSRGFVSGRELREGCLIANVGGGLCQLSNALHLAALEAGMEIVERHAHSKIIPGSVAETGRDATVFWNYKDLRFRAAAPFVIDANLTATHLVVQFRAAKTLLAAKPQEPVSKNTLELETAVDCLECLRRTCIHQPSLPSSD